MVRRKPRKIPASEPADGPIMFISKQTAPEIARRLRIREELHELKAKVVRGKTG